MYFSSQAVHDPGLYVVWQETAEEWKPDIRTQSQSLERALGSNRICKSTETVDKRSDIFQGRQ